MIRWLRLYDEILEDVVVMSLPPPLFRHWVLLLCLANRGEPRGLLPSSVTEIAFRLRLSSEALAEKVLKDLILRGLLEETEAGMTPHNWQKRQYSSDSSTIRSRDHRTKCNVAVGVAPNVAVGVAPNTEEGVAPNVAPFCTLQTDRETEKQTDRLYTQNYAKLTPSNTGVCADVLNIGAVFGGYAKDRFAKLKNPESDVKELLNNWTLEQIVAGLDAMYVTENVRNPKALLHKSILPALLRQSEAGGVQTEEKYTPVAKTVPENLIKLLPVVSASEQITAIREASKILRRTQKEGGDHD